MMEFLSFPRSAKISQALSPYLATASTQNSIIPVMYLVDRCRDANSLRTQAETDS